MAFARTEFKKNWTDKMKSGNQMCRIRRPSESSQDSTLLNVDSKNSEGSTRGSMYEKGKLLKHHHKKLHNMYIKQEKKSDFSNKYQAKYKKPLPQRYSQEKGRWRCARDSPSSTDRSRRESAPAVVQQKALITAEAEPNNERSGSDSCAKADVDEYSDVNMYAASDCSDEPRTKLVDQRKRAGNELDWISIIRYKQACSKLDEKDEAKQKLTRKIELRLDLESQIAEQNARKKKAEDLKRNEKNETLRLAQVFKEEERAEQNKKLQARIRQHEIHQEQNREQQAVHERRDERRRRREQALLAMVRKESEAAKQEAIEKKKVSRAQMEQIKRDNEVQQRERAEEKKRQDQIEIERQQLYIKTIEKQERERQQFYAEKEKKQEQNVQALVSSVSAIEEQARLDELRAIKQQEAYDQKKKLEEDAKAIRIKQEKASIAEHLASQIIEREAKSRELVNADKQYRLQVIADSVKGEARDKREAEERQRKLVEQAQFLEEQMKEIERRKKLEQVAMTDDEMKLNADILRLVEKWDVKSSQTNGYRPRPY